MAPSPSGVLTSRIAASAICFSLFTVVAGAQEPSGQVLRGCVSTATHGVIDHAIISVTRAPDRHTEHASTDARGCYQVRIEPATGDYLVSISAIGYRVFRRRITAGRDTALALDVALTAVPTLSTVRVQAERPVLRRSTLGEVDPGTGESISDGVTGALSPDQLGNLAAIAGTIPGILTTPSGASTLGMNSDQNSTTLNGMAFAGVRLPRDAHVQTRVATSTYDPSRGGFGGSQVAVELLPGNEWNQAQGHLTIDAPALQATDPIGRSSGARFGRIVASVGSEGEVIPGRVTYNAAADFSGSIARVATLENADADILRASGIARDSAAALKRAIAVAGVPAGATQAAVAARSTGVTLIGRIDHTPWARRSWGLTAYVHSERNRSLGSAPTSTSGQLGNGANDVGALYATRSSYFHGTDGLDEFKSAVTVSRLRTRANSLLPQGIVTIPRAVDDVETAFGVGAFGGNSLLDQNSSNWSWETINDANWIVPGGHHAVKLSVGNRLDGFSGTEPANRSGRFNYLSIADVAANRPASFYRNLDSPSSSGSEWTGYASLGDHWYASRSLQFLYGVRLDGNRYLSTPSANAQIKRSFGIRNDHVPNTVGLSPRLGFTWIYSRTGNAGSGFQMPGGTFLSKPRGVIRGGIGSFRGALPVLLVDRAIGATGLAASGSITCIGASVPTPDWTGYLNGSTAIPDTCVTGSRNTNNGGGFAQTARSVSLFDPHFTAPASWRASLEWLPQLPWITFSAQGTYALNLHQSGIEDLNFNDVPRFYLHDEANRPVFVPATEIVPSTGILTSVGSRKYNSFAGVISSRSDVKSVARQLVLSVGSRAAPITYYVRGSWALSDVRELTRGFDNTTFGSPIGRVWAPGTFDVRQQFQLQFMYNYRPKAITLTLFGNVTSGLPFTPTVDGDVNGDGFANDRAFVFDPARSPSNVGSAMTALLKSRDKGVAQCLSSQLGRAAGQNSCRGPWSQSLNIRVGFGNSIPGTHGRAWASLNISNAISGLDQLLHGTGGLRGWGLTAIPDPVLLKVTGFDPIASRYTYAVNQRFGSSSPANMAFRNPFRVTLDVQVWLSKALPVQQLDKWLGPGRAGQRGPRLSASALALKYSRTVPDIYRLILEQSDSLLLAPDQVSALTVADEGYRSRIDSVWAGVGQYLASLPDQVDAADALHHVDAATKRVWALSRDESATMRAILTPIQLQLAPYTVNLVVNTDRPLKGGLIFPD